MTTIRTSLNLSKYDARRLIRDGYEIKHIETYHRDTGDESSIVWTRPDAPTTSRNARFRIERTLRGRVHWTRLPGCTHQEIAPDARGHPAEPAGDAGPAAAVGAC